MSQGGIISQSIFTNERVALGTLLTEADAHTPCPYIQFIGHTAHTPRVPPLSLALCIRFNCASDSIRFDLLHVNIVLHLHLHFVCHQIVFFHRLTST